MQIQELLCVLIFLISVRLMDNLCNNRLATGMEIIENYWFIVSPSRNPATVTIRGFIVDALTGTPIPLSTLQNGNLSFTDTAGHVFQARLLDGVYEVTLPPGSYTRSTQVQGYSPVSTRITFSQGTDESNAVNKIVLAPSMSGVTGGWRVVLRWKHAPEDLDAHVHLPDGTDIFWNNMNSEKVTLDRDGRTVQDGFETITMKNLTTGKYLYFVQRYSNDGLLKDTLATVTVYKDDQQQDFNVPTWNHPDTYVYWKVFEINADTGVMTIIDALTDSL